MPFRVLGCRVVFGIQTGPKVRELPTCHMWSDERSLGSENQGYMRTMDTAATTTTNNKCQKNTNRRNSNYKHQKRYGDRNRHVTGNRNEAGASSQKQNLQPFTSKEERSINTGLNISVATAYSCKMSMHTCPCYYCV